MQTEESIRASELEVENEKLRKDMVLLRNSINRGVEKPELEAQFDALEEENKRRRDECIQLRSILAQRSQNANHSDGQPLSIDANDMAQAFDALKQVNRQLESELTALTAEHNSKLIESNTIIDELREERNKLHDILQGTVLTDSILESDGITNGDISKNQQSLQYLLEEIKTNTKAYAELTEENNRLTKIVDELAKKNVLLSKRLRDNNLEDGIDVNGNVPSMNVAIKRTQANQGMKIFAHLL